MSSGNTGKNWKKDYDTECRDHHDTKVKKAALEIEVNDLRKKLALADKRVAAVSAAERVRQVLAEAMVEVRETAGMLGSQELVDQCALLEEANASFAKQLLEAQERERDLTQRLAAVDDMIDRAETKQRIAEQDSAKFFHYVSRHLQPGWEGKTINDLLQERRGNQLNATLVELLQWLNGHAAALKRKAEAAAAPPATPGPEGIPIAAEEKHEADRAPTVDELAGVPCEEVAG